MPPIDASASTARWVRLALGVVSLGLGLWLILRPFASLSTLVLLVAVGLFIAGVSRIANEEASRLTRALGAIWIAAGVGILLWPSVTMRWLVLVVGLHLILDGLGDMWDGLRSGADQRFASLARGAATVIFGVLALIWPDVTVLVVAIVFAARLIVFGIAQIINPVRGARSADEQTAGRGWANELGAILALIAAGGLAWLSSALNDGRPLVDSFYTTPDQVPDTPGVLIRQEPFERGIPQSAKAWRILYTTTRDEGQPAVASAIVVAPAGQSTEPREVIAWAHGTTGVHETCAPSVLEGTFSTGAFFSVEEVVEEGWALVATDYVGLGTEGPHPYLIGQGEGRSVLDSVRAARQMEGLRLAERTVVWGHSQGGHAALWTGVLAPSYAPEVNVIGVAALAPASDLVGLVDNLGNFTGGSIFAAYAVSAYSAIFDDVDIANYVAANARLNVEAVAGRCLAEPSVLTSVLSAVALDRSAFANDLTDGALSRRLIENIPPHEIQAPLLVGQGGADTLITPQMQDRYVADLCDADVLVDYRTYEGLGHVPLVHAESPLISELFDWTRARHSGEAPTSTC